MKPRRVEYFEGKDKGQKIRLSSLACGCHHVVAVAENGDVYAWGRGEHGCLGVDTKDARFKALPQKIRFAGGQEGTQFSVIPPGGGAKISCGENHTIMAVEGPGKSAAGVWAWGRGSYGQLGHGSGKHLHRKNNGKQQQSLSAFLAMGAREIHASTVLSLSSSGSSSR